MGMSRGSQEVEEYEVRTYGDRPTAFLCRIWWRMRGWEVLEVDHPLHDRWVVKYRKWRLPNGH